MASLKQYTVASVEGLDEWEERGRGCYGAVYEVRLHGLPCIAKRLHDILVGRGREERVSREERRAVIDRFREECVLLSGLRHPNVVQFMGVHYGRDEADISLIMEYMHMDLDQCMKIYPDIPLPYKTSILRDVAYGLAYLHSIPIIHRDLNAGNVLLTESLRAKIADLGVAKLFDRETAMIHTRTLCPGAMDFMPPECLDDESPKYNTKVDIFSFGHLTIYLTNQKAPVVVDRSVTPADVMNNQMQIGKRRRSLTKMGGPDHPLYSIAVQCLSDTPDQRPTSRDLVRRMEELCKKQPLPYKNTLQTVSLSEEISTMKEQVKQLNRQLEQNCVMLDSSIQENQSLVASKDLIIQHLQTKEEAIKELTTSRKSVISFLTKVQRELIEKKLELNKLEEEITVHQAQAQTFKEYFLKERSERERKHSDYCELQQTSSETIRRLEKQLETYQIELQEEKKKRESAEHQRELEEEKKKIQHRTSLQNAEQATKFSESVLQMKTPNPMVKLFSSISEQAIILQVSVEFIGTNTIKAKGTIQQLQKFGNYVTRLHSHWFPQDSSYKLPWLTYVELPSNVHGIISSQAISQRPHNKTAAHPLSPLSSPLPPPPLSSPPLPSLQPPSLPSPLPSPPSEARVISNLCCDVLLLMPKLPYIITPGVQYRAYEERVFILHEDLNASADAFLEAYRKVVSSVKSTEIEVNAELPREEIKSVVVEYNQRYKRCFFVFNEHNSKLKIISTSVRQYEQAQKLLADMFCRPAVRAIEQFNFQNGCFVTVKNANLVDEKCSVIVNDANSQLDHDSKGGVASALNAASNGELQLRSNNCITRCGTVPVGSIAWTGAGGNLKCKHVFHAVGPNASSSVMDDSLCYKIIHHATTRSLSMAEKLNAPSIAFPALSTGINGVSRSTSARAMLSAIEEYKGIIDVRIVISDTSIHEWFAQEVVLRQIQSQTIIFID